MTIHRNKVFKLQRYVSEELAKRFNRAGLEVKVGFSFDGAHDFKIKIFRGAEGLTDSVREFIQDLLPKANPEMWHYSQNAND